MYCIRQLMYESGVGIYRTAPLLLRIGTELIQIREPEVSGSVSHINLVHVDLLTLR